MTLENIRDWLIPISSFFAIISTSLGIWLALKEYRLKLQAETRLAESTRAETDVRLLELFTNILYVATGRRGDPAFVEGIVDLLAKNSAFDANDFKDLGELNSKLAQVAFVSQAPSPASVVAAIASIATLAKRHPVLVEPAIEALKSLLRYKPEISEKYMDSIFRELKLDKEYYLREKSDQNKDS